MIDYGLLGKIYLITGVSRNIGIGAAISHYLAVSGANIFTTYYRHFDELMGGSNSNQAEEIIESLKLQGVQATGIISCFCSSTMDYRVNYSFKRRNVKLKLRNIYHLALF